ncbi:MAG: serine/threonine-protein kinase, partial [Verrucomicrobiota bacterium]
MTEEAEPNTPGPSPATCSACGAALNDQGVCLACGLSFLHEDRVPEQWSEWFPDLVKPVFVGRGGMGEVFRATDRKSRNTVAVKIPLKEHDLNPAFRERMITEAETLSKLDHPGIVRLRRWGNPPNAPPYLVMDYVEGENLQHRLKAGPFSLPTVLDVSIQIARVLAYAHEQGCVHRDIKPPNILLTYNGEVRVTDFGIARWPESPERRTWLEREAGTAYYMADEILNKGRPGEAPADVHSLGVLMIYMLTRELPTGTGLRWIRGVGWSFNRLVARMTRVNPGRRPSADRVLQELIAIRDGGSRPGVFRRSSSIA